MKGKVMNIGKLLLVFTAIGAVPAQANGSADASAFASIRLFNLEVDPSLTVFWGTATTDTGVGIVTGGGSGYATPTYSFESRGFSASASSGTSVLAPPTSQYGGFAAVYAFDLLTIVNDTDIDLPLSFSAASSVSLGAVASGAALAYVGAFYSVLAYSFEVSGAPLFEIYGSEQYYVGSLVGEPDGPRYFDESLAGTFDFELPAGATLQISGYVDASSFAEAQGDVPEPGTWIMMIAGFGLIGLSTRRLRKIRPNGL